MKKVDAWVLRFLFLCLGLKILSGLVKACLPHELPHRWRENDTYGVAVRYFLRWSVETGEDGTRLLPAVLNSGAAVGITPMELPLYNLLAAPFIAVGEVWGFVLAHIVMFAVCSLLLFAASHMWRGAWVEGVQMRLVCLLLALFTLSSTFLYKFMPDFFSFILVFIGMSGAWTKDWKFRAFFVVALGLMIKPTSIVVLGLLVLHPKPIEFAKSWLKWALPAAFFAVLYYTIGLDFVREFEDVIVPFAVEMRPPVASLIEFFSDPLRLIKFLSTELVFVPGVFLFIFVLPALRPAERKVSLKLLMIFFLQMLGLSILAGAHSFKHSYYFIGTAPTIAMLLVISYKGMMAGRMPQAPKVAVLVLCLFSAFGTLVEGARSQSRSILPGYKPALAFQYDCQTLKKRNPDWPWYQGYAFRGFGKVFSEASVCFHEREGENTSPYGIFTAHEPLPEGCKVADQEGYAILAQCQK